MEKRFAVVRVRDGRVLAEANDWKEARRREARMNDNVMVVDRLVQAETAPVQARRKRNRYAEFSHVAQG